MTYWTGQGVSPSAITNDSCREVKPRFLDRCPQGTLVHAAVPVDNLVCRIYRDDAVRVQMLYGEKKNLIKVGADMKPDKYLWIPVDRRAALLGTLKPCEYSQGCLAFRGCDADGEPDENRECAQHCHSAR